MRSRSPQDNFEYSKALYAHSHTFHKKPQAREEVNSNPSQTFLSPGQERLVRRYVDTKHRTPVPQIFGSVSKSSSYDSPHSDLLLDMRTRVETLESTVHQLVGVCHNLLEQNSAMRNQISALKVPADHRPLQADLGWQKGMEQFGKGSESPYTPRQSHIKAEPDLKVASVYAKGMMRCLNG
eukprot:757721-Hanusia_phi.AAC.5